jgi:rhamnulokinase
METYYLAVDIGASSGRHILAHLDGEKIQLEEIYRFENRIKEISGHLCWDLEILFTEIVNGLAKCKTIGKIPASIGIDTWAVDYVLLDQDGNILGNTYSYRDHRTTGMDDKTAKIISPQELYHRTGIQKQIFNTIYQLMAAKEQEPELMKQAQQFLLIPDYFTYRLTGQKKTEYTNATTTQLVNPATKNWDYQLIEKLGFKKSLFCPITMAGTKVGNLKEEIAEHIGFQTNVIQTATHDTASAVLAVPARQKDFIYISSGTWSLMGTEQAYADCSEKSRKANLTNEGGYEYRYRYLKNIMGLWIIQSVRHQWNDAYTFEEICAQTESCKDFPSRIDVNNPVFLAPSDMIQAIQEECQSTGQPVPYSVGEIATVIYQSLAESYGRTIKELETLTKKHYDAIHIVGGGSNADYLNRLTAEATQKTVYSGPAEATAIGNLTVQMIQAGEFKNLEEARNVIFNSFHIKQFDC